MAIDLTQMSNDEFSRISSGHMTPSMAAEYLKEGRIALRTFADVLRAVYIKPDLQQKLTDAFQAAAPDAAPASVARKVRNWLNGQNKPTNREDVYIIAFALGLSEGQAGALLGFCTDYGIHYREPRDLVYAWFLRAGRTYGEAKAFLESLPALERTEEEPQPGQNETQKIQSKHIFLQTEEELRQFYLDNRHLMGQNHSRAYHYFTRYLDKLVHPEPSWDGEDEEIYSLDAVMEQYLSLQMPSGKDRSGYTVCQKLIKKNWPNTTALKNIRAGREDVPRKLLLLLYVITENVLDMEYSELDEDYLTTEERLEDHWWIINAILNDCGMPQLDPRNASDWLILYSLTATDEAMSERMEQVIEYMFEQ